MGYTLQKFQRLVFMMFLVFAAIPVLFLILGSIKGTLSVLSALGVFAVFACILFYTLISLPKIQCNVLGYKIDQDMPSMTRKFVINLQSGMSLFSAYADLAKSSDFTARFFDEVVSKIYLGQPIEKAIEESIHLSPSKSFRKVQTQVKSALMTGSDLEAVMEVTLQEMIHEQINKINLYGKKLGPLAMVYLIFGTVLPSIGSVGLVIILSIALSNIQESFFTIVFGLLLGFILLVQFIFINLFSKTRPNLKI